jgi:hypothetical protein
MTDYPSLDQVSSHLYKFLFWPLLLWEKLFVPDCGFCVSLEGLILAVIYNVLIYSLLTYVILRWLESRKSRIPPLP